MSTSPYGTPLTPQQIQQQSAAQAHNAVQALVGPLTQKLGQNYQNQSSDLTGLTGALVSLLQGQQMSRAGIAQGMPSVYQSSFQRGVAPALGAEIASGGQAGSNRPADGGVAAAMDANTANSMIGAAGSAASRGALMQNAARRDYTQSLDDLQQKGAEQFLTLRDQYRGQLQDQAFKQLVAQQNQALAESQLAATTGYRNSQLGIAEQNAQTRRDAAQAAQTRAANTRAGHAASQTASQQRAAVKEMRGLVDKFNGRAPASTQYTVLVSGVAGTNTDGTPNKITHQFTLTATDGADYNRQLAAIEKQYGISGAQATLLSQSTKGGSGPNAHATWRRGVQILIQAGYSRQKAMSLVTSYMQLPAPKPPQQGGTPNGRSGF